MRRGACRFALALLALAACGDGGDVVASDGDEDHSAFQGSWFRHGMGLEVGTDGRFEIRYRVYEWCDDNPLPCDSISDDGVITNGGRMIGRLERSTERSAKVVVESDTADLEIEPAVFELLEDGTARLAGLVLCTDTTYVLACGA